MLSAASEKKQPSLSGKIGPLPEEGQSAPTEKNPENAAGNVCMDTESVGEVPQMYRIAVGTKGRGLFAIQNIPPNTLIHVAPCIWVPKQEYDNHLRHTVLEHYLFNDTSRGNKLLALGHGSLFNHSQHPNVDYRVDSVALCIRYLTGHNVISNGEELCINYGGNLWFDDADDKKDDATSSSSDDSVADGSNVSATDGAVTNTGAGKYGRC